MRIVVYWAFLTGCKLSEFERVTALKVYNWFANRRKEMKRRANIGEDGTPARVFFFLPHYPVDCTGRSTDLVSVHLGGHAHL